MMKKILIVDDNTDIRKMMCLVLSQQFTVIEAVDADSAYQLIALEKPDGVVLDIMMPGVMNGLQLCERLKQDAQLKDIYVVLASARGQKADEATGLLAGANAYFIKPFSPFALLNHLKQILA